MRAKDIEWFKREFDANLKRYDVSFRFYNDGDLGALNQATFDSSEKGGSVDFWGLGWLGISLYDYKNDKELMNILLEPDQENEKEDALKRLLELL